MRSCPGRPCPWIDLSGGCRPRIPLSRWRWRARAGLGCCWWWATSRISISRRRWLSWRAWPAGAASRCASCGARRSGPRRCRRCWRRNRAGMPCSSSATATLPRSGEGGCSWVTAAGSPVPAWRGRCGGRWTGVSAWCCSTAAWASTWPIAPWRPGWPGSRCSASGCPTGPPPKSSDGCCGSCRPAIPSPRPSSGRPRPSNSPPGAAAGGCSASTAIPMLRPTAGPAPAEYCGAASCCFWAAQPQRRTPSAWARGGTGAVATAAACGGWRPTRVPPSTGAYWWGRCRSVWRNGWPPSPMGASAWSWWTAPPSPAPTFSGW